MDNTLIPILLLAAMVEAVWQTLKMVWQPKQTLGATKGKINPDKIGALAVGVLIAFGSGLDLPTLVGIPMSIPYLGVILTGILISRGAGFVHDLFTYLKSLKEILRTKADVAAMARTAGIKIDASNLPEGTIVSVDTTEAEKTVKPSIMEKTKNMLSGLGETTSRIVKVIRSTPEISTEDKQPEDSTDPSIVKEEPADSIVKEDIEGKEGDNLLQ